MGLKGGERIVDITIDRVFIGSCTNARIEDLREVARAVNGKMVNSNVYAMIVPGSGRVSAGRSFAQPFKTFPGVRR
jgi:3-isopropylmalate/(R)-2-methylmalate dehydratase large subunit